jgi:DNA-binding response OmpR family regulator
MILELTIPGFHPMPKLLVVDDDKSLCEMLKVILGESYTIDLAHDAEDGRLHLEQYGYDLIIMDWELGGTTGASLLKHLRATGCSTPCLMLTGRADNHSLEYGLVEAGADDYLTKPFSAIELRARLTALLRRQGTYVQENIDVGGVVLDRSAKVISRGDHSVGLHKHEFLILELLLKNAGVFFTAEQLLSRIWNSESTVSIDNVRMHVSNLRKKLKSIDAEDYLKSERGLGYAFRAKQPGSA